MWHDLFHICFYKTDCATSICVCRLLCVCLCVRGGGGVCVCVYVCACVDDMPQSVFILGMTHCAYVTWRVHMCPIFYGSSVQCLCVSSMYDMTQLICNMETWLILYMWHGVFTCDMTSSHVPQMLRIKQSRGHVMTGGELDEYADW